VPNCRFLYKKLTISNSVIQYTYIRRALLGDTGCAVELAKEREVVRKSGAEHGVLLPKTRGLIAGAPDAIIPRGRRGQVTIVGHMVAGAVVVSVARDLRDLDEGVRDLQWDLVCGRAQRHRRLDQSIDGCVTLGLTR
jgi:hypothetical protein